MFSNGLIMHVPGNTPVHGLKYSAIPAPNLSRQAVVVQAIVGRRSDAGLHPYPGGNEARQDEAAIAGDNLVSLQHIRFPLSARRCQSGNPAARFRCSRAPYLP